MAHLLFYDAKIVTKNQLHNRALLGKYLWSNPQKWGFAVAELMSNFVTYFINESRMNHRKPISPAGEHLSKEMKLVELINVDYNLLSILQRLNVRLPFGDISVEEMCRREGFSTELFMTICNIYIDEEYRPSIDTLSADALPRLIGYLRASHHYYLEDILPHATMHLESILSYCDSLSGKTLRRFYDDYKVQVRNHLEYEEQHMFPRIETLSDGNGLHAATELDMPHSEIDDLTGDITSLVIKYLPEQAPTSLRCELLFHIFRLRDDLRRHALIESRLLTPLVERLSKSKKQ